MSNVVSKIDEDKISKQEVLETIALESVINDNADNKPVTTMILVQMFELFLNENKEELDKYKIVLYPEIQKYLLEFCQENQDFFIDAQNSLKQIIIDNEISAKDIPEILCLIIKIYGFIKHKTCPSNVDPYEIIELIIQILLVVYLKQTNKLENVEDINASVGQIISIIRVAVELLKLPIIKVSKDGCLTRLFKKNK